MPLLLSVLLAVETLRFQSGPIEQFITAANGGAEAFKTYLEKSFSTTDTAFLQRLAGFREQAAPLTLVKLGYKNDQVLKALIKDKEGQELTLTLYVNNETPPKVTGVFLGNPKDFDQAPPKTYSNWKDIQDLAAQIQKDSAVPAITIAVVREGKLEVGIAGERQIGKGVTPKPDEIWNMGSIGKSMTATLIARLVEEGKLKWDSTLGELLPDIKMKEPYRTVKMSQILRHRGGIPQDSTFTYQRVQDCIKGATEPVKIRSNYAEDILSRDPISTPGTQFAYSNAGYTLAGVIAERLTGKPYERLMHEYVFNPLGMKSARVGAEKLTDERPRGHVKDEDGKPVQHEQDDLLNMMIAPAGTVSCSVGDLARYAREHMAGLKGESVFLKKETFAELHRGEGENQQDQYACAWSVGPLPGTSVRHGHNGSNGTFLAEMSFFPAKDLVVISVINQGNDANVSPPMQAILAVGRKFAPRQANH